MVSALGLSMWAARAETIAQMPIWSAKQVESECRAGIANVKRLERQAASTASQKLSGDKKLALWNALMMAHEDIDGPVSVLANMHPDKAVRDAAEACVQKLTPIGTARFQNKALLAFTRTFPSRDAIEQKLKADLQNSFEDAGASLPAAKRKVVKGAFDRLHDLELEFERNLRDNPATMAFTEAEVRGVPEGLLKAAKRTPDGKYVFGFSYAELEPFMSNAEDAGARERYQFAYSMKGTPRNVDILKEVLAERSKIANAYGLKDFAEFATRRRMVERPERVEAFLGDVRRALDGCEGGEIEALRAEKAAHVGDEAAKSFRRWDYFFYEEKLKQKRFKVDQEALREHFPSAAALDWTLGLASELYGIRFKKREVPVWHTEVSYYDVFESSNNAFIGGLYVDLYPREGKYGHAAVWPVRAVSTAAGRKPYSVLVTNFNRRGLDFQELETLVHEFGHAMHGILSNTRFVQQGGTNVTLDFVEAPSQMFEEWAQRKESLQRFTQHCSGCKPISDEMLARLKDAQRFGQCIRYSRQHLYANYDMTLNRTAGAEPLPLWAKMEGATPMGYAPGSQFIGTFGHLASHYGAGYYAYMWSKVLALDMLSAFGDNVMNGQVGRRFREHVLSRGGEAKADELVRNFLGREANTEAFFKEITGKR